MIPQPDDTRIRLPITFDYQGGRSTKVRGNILFTIVLVVVTLIVVIGLITNTHMKLYLRVPLAIGIFYLVTLFLRMRTFSEKVYSDAYESLNAVDYKPGTPSFWKIFDIETEYPYISHFVGGKKGIFIRFEKDVVVGKPETVEYDHFDAISQALNIAGEYNVEICHLDYMDNVGNDPRMQKITDDAGMTRNPELRTLLIDMYTHIQLEMSSKYASFDTYVITTTGRESMLWECVEMFCSEMLGANYITYKVLDSNGIRETCQTLMNLEKFSAVQASRNLLEGQRHRGIKPLTVYKEDGRIIDLTGIPQEPEEDSGFNPQEDELDLFASTTQPSEEDQQSEDTDIYEDDTSSYEYEIEQPIDDEFNLF